MPGGDRTGPLGYGPMTGRGAGYCAGFAVPGFMNLEPMGFGRGGRSGRGGGRGYRHRYWYYATGLPGWSRDRWGTDPRVPPPPGYSPTLADDEPAMLKQQAECYERALRDIKKRLADLVGAAAEGAA